MRKHIRIVIVFFPLLLGSVTASAQSIKDAVEAAWQRSPQGQSAAAWSEEAQARVNAADRWFAEPPALSIGQRTGRSINNSGARENELEISLPIRAWNSRATDQVLAAAEQAEWSASLQYARWRLAGEVREAYWNTRLAEIERELALQKAASSARIADDAARRVKAGELARIDQNRAEAERDAAEIASMEATIKARQAAQAFTLLTGLPIGLAIAESANDRAFVWQTHPAYTNQSDAVHVARARADQAVKVTRDPLEFTLATSRERGNMTEPTKSTLRVGIRIPFAADARNKSPIAKATAARIEAEAFLPLIEQRLRAEHQAARDVLSGWQSLAASADRRVALARDTAQLIDKSFRLGETDLPTRLRAENERFEAERASARAVIELKRAISNLNQSSGLLP